MTNACVGREPVQIVEILQPICANVYGSAPCTATSAAGGECFNTRFTCQDPANFALDATPKSLFFGDGHLADKTIEGVPYIFPCLRKVSTAPTKINLAGTNPDASGLGNRALATIEFADFQHTDRQVDPYVTSRGYNPLTKASFWSKWLRRNPYRSNIQVNIYEGYADERLVDMVKRVYFIESMDGPTSGGRITLRAKDLLSRTEARKAQAPVLSPGVLYADINSTVDTFEVANAIEADYPASGTIRINDEVMTYTSRATSTNGITFSGVARGSDNTVADEHEAEDTVQECLRYVAARPDTVVADLLQNYSNIPAAFLDTANWATEVDLYLSFYTVTRLLTEPHDVSKLLSELQQQVLFSVWWDERLALVQFSAIKARTDAAPVLTEENNVIEGSFSIKEKPRERASQVWFYYLLRNPVEDKAEAQHYQQALVTADLESETDELYGESSVMQIYSNWIVSDALAQTTSSKLVARYSDTPREAVLRTDAKDRAYWTGDVVQLFHSLDVDQFGDPVGNFWTIMSAEEVVAGEVVQYTLQDTTAYGKFYFIMDNATADWTAGDEEVFKSAYITDANGFLSDGITRGAIIA